MEIIILTILFFIARDASQKMKIQFKKERPVRYINGVGRSLIDVRIK